MKRFAIILMVMVVWALPLGGQHWSIELDPSFGNVVGANPRIGDVYRYSQVDVQQGSTRTTLYGTTYEPIEPRPKLTFFERGEVLYRSSSGWGIGVSGFYLQQKSSVDGRVSSPEGSLNELYINGVRLWGQSLTPVENDLEPSGFSPVRYWASNTLSIGAFDLFATKNLSRNGLMRLDATLGVRVGAFVNTRVEGQAQHAFVPESIYIPSGPKVWYDWDNHIELESVGEARGVLAGPSVGLRSETRIGRALLSASLTQSVLVGNMTERGVWTDVDDVNATNGPIVYEKAYYLKGVFPFEERESVAIPVTDLKVGLGYVLTKHLIFGVQGFASAWYNCPLAPSWNVPGAWNALKGSGWHTERSTTVLRGVGASVAMRF